MKKFSRTPFSPKMSVSALDHCCCTKSVFPTNMVFDGKLEQFPLLVNQNKFQWSDWF